MEERHGENAELDQNEQNIHPFETTRIDEKLYNVELLGPFAESIPVQEIPSEIYREAVGEGHYYWIDRNREKLGPFQILRDWEAAQKNPAWADHVEIIKNANQNRPIWAMRDGQVFNGMHRLTKIFIDGIPTVKVKVFDALPDSALISE